MSYAIRQYFIDVGLLSWMKAVVCWMYIFYFPVEVLQSPHLEVVCSVIGNTVLQNLIVQ